MNRKTSLVLACLLLIFTVVQLAGCGQTAEAMAQKKEIVQYLEEAKADIATVHEAVNDEDLDIGSEAQSDAEITEAQLQKVQGMLAKIEDYKSRVDARIDLLQKRNIPDNDDMKEFAMSEEKCLQLSSEVLDEYRQIANYMLTIYNMSLEMVAIGQIDLADMQNLEANYKSFSEGVAKAVDVLKNANPPSFLQSVNEGLIEVFIELQDAVVYVLNATVLNDPLMMDAGAYRIELLMRKISKVTTDTDADVARRVEKLKQDIEEIKKLDSGLTDWIEENIEALGA